jgi:D-aminopeptidase
VRGVELAPDDARTVRFGGDDLLDLFRTFVTLVMLTRALVE